MMNSKQPRFRRATFAKMAAVAVPLGIPFIPRAAFADVYTIRLGITNAMASVQGATALRLATSVRDRSKGQINLEVYPNGQLAGQQEIVEALINGTMDLTIVSTSFLVPILPQFQLFDLPFLFRDAATAFRVLDGPIGGEFFASLETKGMLGLGWGYVGIREIETTTKPIVVPDDLKGVRIRVQSGAVFVSTFLALGAQPIAIDANETYTALSQHTLDAVELPIPSFTALKMQTVCKHVALSNHVFAVSAIVGGKRKIEGLPAPLQRILRAEMKAAVPFWRTAVAHETEEQTDLLRRGDVAFTDTRYPLFAKAVEPVYGQVRAKVPGDMIDRLVRASNAR